MAGGASPTCQATRGRRCRSRCPLRGEPYDFAGFPPFLEGLLPAGPQLQAIPRKHKIDRADCFRQLIIVGQDVVGSLTIEECPTEEGGFKIVDRGGQFILKPNPPPFGGVPATKALTMTLAEIAGIEVPVRGWCRPATAHRCISSGALTAWGEAQLARLLRFCYLTGNEDLHLRNFSLVVRNGVVRLSPAYDLLNTTLVLGNAAASKRAAPAREETQTHPR